MERLAAKAGVPEECVVYTLGTSMANYIALTELVHRGDEVLIERPTYDPLLTILDHIGAKVSRFDRRPEKGFGWGWENWSANLHRKRVSLSFAIYTTRAGPIQMKTRCGGWERWRLR
jgi:aspartate/methionine/tyrosine aminotransferase